MAFWSLKTGRGLLKDRRDDLERAKRLVKELEGTCADLEQKVAELERDERALARGYVALMGDAAAARS